MKHILFRHCLEAEKKAIRVKDKPEQRLEGGNRQAEAEYTALLGVITEAKLQDEYRLYKRRKRGKINAERITGLRNADKLTGEAREPVGQDH